jgi:hypothetical protein
LKQTHKLHTAHFKRKSNANIFEDEKEDYVDRNLIVNYLKSFRQKSNKKLFEIRESLNNHQSFNKIRQEMLRHSREQNYYNEQLKQMRISESKHAIQ